MFLNSSKTPIGNVYDYLYSTADDEIEKLLSIFTFYSPSRIESIMKEQTARPEKRYAQKVLAERVTHWLGSYRNLKEELMKTS